MISVCMIAWNEEDLLASAIASTEGLADEVIVCDTGSNDDTVEIARKLGAKVFTGADRMNKGEARNMALREASGEWCVILDADEQIADPAGLREFLEATDAGGVYIKLCYMSGDKPSLSYQQMRCWKKGLFEYRYRAHEVPLPLDGWPKIAHTDFVWEHRPPSGRGVWKIQYTLQRLIMDVAENPNDSRQWYYLGRQYRYSADWMKRKGEKEGAAEHYKKALEWLGKYLEQPGRDSADAWADLAICHAGLGNKEKEIGCLYRAAAANPMRRDWWCKLAKIYRADNNHQLAVGLLKLAIEIPLPKLTYTHHIWHGEAIHDLLARSLWKLRRYEEGYEQAQVALSLAPDNKQIRMNFLFFADLFEKKGGLGKPLGLIWDERKRVLFASDHNAANGPHRLANAINRRDDWQARVAVRDAAYFCYSKDIVKPTEEELDRLYDWADVIVFDDTWDAKKLLTLDKPLFHFYHGSYYRANYEKLNEFDAQHNIPQLCSTPDLLEFGRARWIPLPIERMYVEPAKRDAEFIITHATTHRIRKGTPHIEKLAEMPGVKIDIIEGVSNSESLARTAAGDLAISQFGPTYGVYALEAWALGKPVIAGVEDSVVDVLMEAAGVIPFLRATPETVAEQVEILRRSEGGRRFWRDVGQDYIERVHNPYRVANILARLFGHAIVSCSLKNK